MSAIKPPSQDESRGQQQSDIEALCEALLSFETADEIQRFMLDLSTPGELRALAERWRVAQLLDTGAKSYREISAETGVSTTTVTRVARFLSQEPHQGYRLALSRRKEARS